VTDAGGSREAVRHEETGLVMPKRDPDALAEALLRMLRDPGLRQEMGKAGRRRARKEFTRERMVEKITTIYDDNGDEVRSACSHDPHEFEKNIRP